jgi:hypothetical protein
MDRLIKLQDQRLMLIERQFEADLKVRAIIQLSDHSSDPRHSTHI